MPVLNGRGLRWFTSLVKTYIGIPWTLSNENDTAIEENDNLNNYNTIGNYYCSTGNVASTVENSPTKNAFILKVYSAAGNSTEYMTQCVEDQYNALWRRYKYSSLGEWGDWFRFPIADSGDVGGEVNPMYIANGQFVASTANVGGDAQPVRLNNGVIEALSATVGDDETPVYLKAGVLTACTSGGAGIKQYSFSNPGYVVFDFGLIIQWGSTMSSTTITFPIPFSSSTSYAIVKNAGSSNKYKITDREVSFYNKTATTATTYSTYSGKSQWIAIGY